jgi:hypothetical protein
MKWKPSIALLILAGGLNVFSQGTPPVVRTDIVKLTPQTRLIWQPNPPAEQIAGYWAAMKQGTNEWRAFTTNTFMPLLTLNSNLVSGSYDFAVTAVNTAGLESASSPFTTNVVRPPSVVVNVRIEIQIE